MMSLGNPVLNQAVQFEASAWLIYVCDLLSINVAIEHPLKLPFVGGYPVPHLITRWQWELNHQPYGL